MLTRNDNTNNMFLTILVLLTLLSISQASPSLDKRYYINAADWSGATTLPDYLTTGTAVWDKATLTTFDWNTWDNPQYETATASVSPQQMTSSFTFPTTTTSFQTSSLSKSTSTNSLQSATSTFYQHTEFKDAKTNNKSGMVVGIVLGIFFFFLIVAGILFFLCYSHKKKAAQDIEKNADLASGSRGIVGSSGINGAAVAAAAGIAAGAGAVEVLGNDDDKSRLRETFDDNASTITGSFASLSEKLKEIQEQYSNDDMSVSTMHEDNNDDLDSINESDFASVANGSVFSNSKEVNAADDVDSVSESKALDYPATAATGVAAAKRESIDSFASTMSSTSGHSDVSSLRSSLKNMTPSIKQAESPGLSPKATMTEDRAESIQEEDEEEEEEIVPLRDSPNVSTVQASPLTFTGTSTDGDSVAPSFKKDENFPNKYNNFATEFLATKERKESESTVKAENSENDSISSKPKRESTFDFETGTGDAEPEQPGRKSSDASYFTESIN